MLPRSTAPSLTAGGRTGVRRLLVVSACFLHFLGITAAAGPAKATRVTVREEASRYRVAASFTVPETPAAAMAVLTDYDNISRFMPDMRTSRVMERAAGRVTIEQEAVARFMMFSKTIHLVLQIEEHPRSLHFRDVCGTSFSYYQGGWSVTEAAGRTHITYELTAQPSFEVPEFLLKRLLKRDSTRMMERLQAEIASRSQRSALR